MIIPWFIMKLAFIVKTLFNNNFFNLISASNQWFSWVFRKCFIFNYLLLIKDIIYHLMEVFSEIISTFRASMTIVNCKKTALWPLYYMFFRFWLHNIQNYRYSVLIVVSNHTLMCICCIWLYYSVIFIWTFWIFYLKVFTKF